MTNKLRIGYINGDEMVYPFEKPEDRPVPSKVPPKKVHNRRHTDHKKTDHPFHSAEFITPENNTKDILIKGVWIDVYIASITAGDNSLIASTKAKSAIEEFKEVFHNG